MTHRPRDPYRVLPLLATAVCLQAAAVALAEDDLVTRIDESLQRAEHFLLDQQQADGGWNSRTYGALRSGPTLTPYVMSCLPFMPGYENDGRAAYERAVERLIAPIDFDTTVGATPSGEAIPRLDVGSREFVYPIYTAAMASRMVAHPKPPTARQRGAQLAYLHYVLQRQFNEDNGWRPDDVEYGGWGFAIGPPTRPAEGPNVDPMLRSNLSATMFGLAALRSAGVPSDDPAYARVRVFVERCQNFAEQDASGPFDDGGFFFVPGDAGQNKAGAAGVDSHGRERFHSYGTMTADGLRCLVLLGHDADHPRVRASAAWLTEHFSADENPGAFPAEREVLRNATHYYWAWSAAHAMMTARRLAPDEGDRATYFAFADNGHVAALAEAMLARQQVDGAWRNRFTDAKEDDPLIATPWAAATLAVCKSLLASPPSHGVDRCNAHR